MAIEQEDLFQEVPVIIGLGITEFKLKGGSVRGVVEGATNTNDIALLNNPCWQKAVAAWLIELHGGDVDVAMDNIKNAYVDFVNQHGEAHRETPISAGNVTRLKN